MTTHAIPSVRSNVSAVRTRAMLLCGVVAGPLFAATVVIQSLTRPGFDARRHQLSLLSLGDLGWIQVANFVVAGALVLVSAVGARRVLSPGRAGTWGPILLSIYGGGLIWAGVFVTDPAFGFPAGTPDGGPTHVSWHGALHIIAPSAMNIALVAACIVFARRYAGLGRGAWTAYCLLAGVLDIVLIGASFATADFRVMLVSGVVIWTWASIVTADLMANLPPQRHDRQP